MLMWQTLNTQTKYFFFHSTHVDQHDQAEAFCGFNFQSLFFPPSFYIIALRNHNEMQISSNSLILSISAKEARSKQTKKINFVVARERMLLSFYKSEKTINSKTQRATTQEARNLGS
jgi:hypothetical protein